MIQVVMNNMDLFEDSGPATKAKRILSLGEKSKKTLCDALTKIGKIAAECGEMQSLIVANPKAGAMNEPLAATVEHKCPAIRTRLVGLLEHAQGKKEMSATH